jgi:hypothetical protein
MLGAGLREAWVGPKFGVTQYTSAPLVESLLLSFLGQMVWDPMRDLENERQVFRSLYTRNPCT